MKRAGLKLYIVIAAAVLLSFVISGCAVIPADISELEKPPRLTGEQQAIENALESREGSKITLKYPLSGDYRSAFVLKDLNHDGKKEAVAFYCQSNGAAGPHIALLSQEGGKWKFDTDIGSDGSEIDCVSFGDFEGKGSDDIAVGWRSFNSTDLNLMVYSKNSKGSYDKNNLGTFTKMETLDMDGDGRPDILTLKLDSNQNLAYASLISFKNGKLGRVARAPLDSTVTSYAGVYVTKIDSKTNGVLVDGSKSAENMITELIYYKNGRLLAPFYDPASHTVNITLRKASYECMDINGDGIVDIPVLKSLPYKPDSKDDNGVYLVAWSDFDGKSSLTPKLSAIMNYSENYYFIYPDKWGSNVTVDNRSGNNLWEFCEWDFQKGDYGKVLFSIIVYKENDWENIPDKSNLFKLADKNGAVYAVRMPSQRTNDGFTLTVDEIKKDFTLLQ